MNSGAFWVGLFVGLLLGYVALGVSMVLMAGRKEER